MKEIKRNYNFADADLLAVARLLVVFATRDVQELATYGYALDTPTSLQNLITAFATIPTDVELEQIQAEATLDKTAKDSALKTSIKEITNRAKLALDEASPKFKRFGIKGLDNMKDADLSVCGQRVATVALALLPEIAVKGVTQDMITAVMTAKTAFDKSMVEQEEKMSQRSIAAGERIGKGNDLYAFTVTLADAGKSYWFNKNEAKHSNYVLYDNQGRPVTPTTNSTPPQ